MIGGDLADWSVIPTAQQVAQLAGVGLSFAIVGTSYATPNTGAYVADDQIAAFVAGGFDVQVYEFPGVEKPSTYGRWADAENAQATIDTLRQMMRDGFLGPYSRAGFAAPIDWDCKAEFPDSKLYDARYITHRGPCLIQQAIDTGGDIAAAIATEFSWVPQFVGYWGFTEADVAIVQWHDSITIFGVNIDLDWRADRMYSDADIDAKVGEALALGVRNQKDLADLANGQDALPSLKGQLRYLWALAKKPWPF